MTLYDAIEERHPTATTSVTRSTQEDWLPGIKDDNMSHVLLRRNQQAANAVMRRRLRVRFSRPPAETDGVFTLRVRSFTFYLGRLG